MQGIIQKIRVKVEVEAGLYRCRCVLLLLFFVGGGGGGDGGMGRFIPLKTSEGMESDWNGQFYLDTVDTVPCFPVAFSTVHALT